MRKLAALLLGVVITASALAGCGGGQEPAQNDEISANAQTENDGAESAGEGNKAGDAENDGTVAGEGSQEQKTIRILSAMQLVDEDMMQAFMDENADITVEYEYVDSGNYSAKFAALASANDLPDVFWTQAGYYCDQINEGLLRDLSDEMVSPAYEGDIAWKDTFVPSLLENFQHIAYAGCGEMESYDYGVPFTMTTVAVMYNKNIYEELELAEPETWKIFMENLDTITEAGYTALSVQNNTCSDWLARLFWDQFCREELEDQGLTFESGEMSFHSESVRKGLEEVKHLWDEEYLSKSFFTADLDTTAQMFLQQELAQVLIAPDKIEYIMDNLPEDMTIATYALPGIAGLPSRSLGGSSNIFAVSAVTEESEAAVRLVKYLTSRTNFETAEGLKYSNSGLLDVEKGAELDDILQGYTNAAAGGFCPDVFVPTNANTEISTKFRDTLLPNYLLDEIDLDEVCDTLQELYEEYLEDKE